MAKPKGQDPGDAGLVFAAHSRLRGRGRTETSGLPVIDAAPRLGRVTGLTGKDEVIWLRACRKRPGMAATRSWSDAYLQSPIIS